MMERKKKLQACQLPRQLTNYSKGIHDVIQGVKLHSLCPSLYKTISKNFITTFFFLKEKYTFNSSSVLLKSFKCH